MSVDCRSTSTTVCTNTPKVGRMIQLTKCVFVFVFYSCAPFCYDYFNNYEMLESDWFVLEMLKCCIRSDVVTRRGLGSNQDYVIRLHILTNYNKPRLHLNKWWNWTIISWWHFWLRLLNMAILMFHEYELGECVLLSTPSYSWLKIKYSSLVGDLKLQPMTLYLPLSNVSFEHTGAPSSS